MQVSGLDIDALAMQLQQTQKQLAATKKEVEQKLLQIQEQEEAVSKLLAMCENLSGVSAEMRELLASCSFEQQLRQQVAEAEKQREHAEKQREQMAAQLKQKREQQAAEKAAHKGSLPRDSGFDGLGPDWWREQR